ncbi:MAG: peptide-methionine (S)-S-oxide reductase [Acidobacteria bacterium]|nr:MAG: peptide-methionine (S)-S-oxide reductase [Acidobacteriota bacterium]REJ99102.1 MAG: peptide-methionine (S)-S-oxide reductase [Acidobacteriota bacterium]REK16177.1 MAG: peptide-methionine (S)-S-oxide reductase [Acidobacteriota bacterium]REK43858.1 MAG: peptide-methionine (S)-S-oxide reductase [Acidobacteriota bacterium]
MTNGSIETATVGGGCFWCTEAVYLALKGIEEVVSGYSGGQTENPTYQEVCTGATGHAEVVQVKFDSDEISFKEVLQIFFATHDPTTLNRQGNDVGTQYRSVVFYHSPEQRDIAEKLIAEIEKQAIFDDPILTEVVEFSKFYPAEDYHQNYFEKNPNQPYCTAVVAPKVAKFRKVFFDRLKK